MFGLGFQWLKKVSRFLTLSSSRLSVLAPKCGMPAEDGLAPRPPPSVSSAPAGPAPRLRSPLPTAAGSPAPLPHERRFPSLPRRQIINESNRTYLNPPLYCRITDYSYRHLLFQTVLVIRFQCCISTHSHTSQVITPVVHGWKKRLVKF